MPDTDELPEPSIEVATTFPFAAGTLTATIRPLPIASPEPTGGYNGFHSLARLSSGRFVAIGFDAEGDGVQAERAGIWLSDDGQRWRRTGLEVGSQRGQQSLRVVRADGDRILVFGTDLGIADFDNIEQADAYVYRSDDGGETWDQELIGQRTVIIDAVMTPEGPLLAVIDGTVGQPRAAVLRQVDGRWERTLLSGPGGGDERASGVNALHVGDDGAIYVLGTRSTTDPGVDDAPPFDLFSEIPYPPVDVAMWRSADGGLSWEAWLDDGFAGQPGAQGASRMVITPTGTFLATIAETDEGGAFVPRIWRLEGDGWVDQWIDLGTGASEFAVGVWMVPVPGRATGDDGGIAILSTHYMDRVAYVRAALYEPVSRTLDSVDVTSESYFQQLEDVVEVGGGAYWLVGRLERGRNETDLQLMELQVG